MAGMAYSVKNSGGSRVGSDLPYLEFAADADRVLVIDDGRVLADGSPSEALDRYIGAMAR